MFVKAMYVICKVSMDTYSYLDTSAFRIDERRYFFKDSYISLLQKGSEYS